jgi:hypothetical protein
MQLKKSLAVAASLLWLSLPWASAGNAAPKTTFKPASGGYSLTVPAGSKEIYHTSTGIRFTVGRDFLVSADLYTLPSFISVPMKQYSSEQKKDFTKFLTRIQDQENDTIQEDGTNRDMGSAPALDGILERKLRKYRRTSGEAEPQRADKKKGPDSYTYVAVPQEKLRTHRPFLIGRAYQPEKNVLLVVNVSAPEKPGIRRPPGPEGPDQRPDPEPGEVHRCEPSYRTRHGVRNGNPQRVADVHPAGGQCAVRPEPEQCPYGRAHGAGIFR